MAKEKKNYARCRSNKNNIKSNARCNDTSKNSCK